MPATTIYFFRDDDGRVSIKEWLEDLAQRDDKAHKKCLVYLKRLQQEGHELRRPTADLLRDGVYELRPSYQGVNYRILYGFAGKDVVVVSHGLTKERTVPSKEIDKAVVRLAKYQQHPNRHAYPEDIIHD